MFAPKTELLCIVTIQAVATIIHPIAPKVEAMTITEAIAINQALMEVEQIEIPSISKSETLIPAEDKATEIVPTTEVALLLTTIVRIRTAEAHPNDTVQIAKFAKAEMYNVTNVRIAEEM